MDIIGYIQIKNMKLRKYQIEAVEQIQAKFRGGYRYILLVLHMGLGKTLVSSRMIQLATQNNKRVLFLAHRTFLITQCRDKLERFGIKAGLIKAGFKEDRTQKVQIASIQTLKNRKLPLADLVIIDEAHHAVSNEYKKVIQKYKDNGAYIVGLTATSFLTNKKIGLDEVFQDYVNTITVQQAIEQGYLLESKVYCSGNLIDTKNISKSKGDFDNKELFKAFDLNDVYKNLVNNYHSKIGKKKAIIFCVNKEHCRKVTETLNSEGYKGSYVVAETPESERVECLKKLSSGEYDFMANCDVYTEGFDMPELEATVLCYATVSKAKYFQSASRAGRPLPEDEGVPYEKKKKPYFVILDMADNTKRHYPLEFPFDISLAPQKTKEKSGVAPIKDCPSCGFMMKAQLRKCPECGHEMPVKKTKQEIEEEVFVELDKLKLKVAPYLNLPKDRWNEIPTDLLEAFAKEKGYKKGWVNYMKLERGEGKKKVKILNYDEADYHKQCAILRKAYFEKTYPIDAHVWGFVGENDKEVIFEYKLKEKESIL